MGVATHKADEGLVVLACGSRDWTACGVVEATISALHFQRGIARLVHGACRGADRMAGEVAKQLGIVVQPYPAEWRDASGRLDRSAGPRRNRQMFVEGKPNLVIAFHDQLAGSRGTRDMVEVARATVDVWVVRSDGTKQVYPAGSGSIFS